MNVSDTYRNRIALATAAYAEANRNKRAALNQVAEAEELLKSAREIFSQRLSDVDQISTEMLGSNGDKTQVVVKLKDDSCWLVHRYGLPINVIEITAIAMVQEP